MQPAGHCDEEPPVQTMPMRLNTRNVSDSHLIDPAMIPECRQTQARLRISPLFPVAPFQLTTVATSMSDALPFPDPTIFVRMARLARKLFLTSETVFLPRIALR